MVLQQSRVSASSLGSLTRCLVEGDPEQERRAGRVKRRAIFVSILVQALVVLALVIFPLLSKGEHISFERTPIPPYPRLGSHEHRVADAHHSAPQPPCHFCAPSSPNHPIVTRDSENSTANNEPSDAPFIEGVPNGIPDGNPFAPANNGPKPLIEERMHDRQQTTRISVGHIEPALLLQRVEPAFPHIALTLHHETHVELHAIISTDGSVKSLEVLSGDPLFYQSALDAVRQWRYRPTYLNGQPVEVDTHITVIYTINH